MHIYSWTPRVFIPGIPDLIYEQWPASVARLANLGKEISRASHSFHILLILPFILEYKFYVYFATFWMVLQDKFVATLRLGPILYLPR